MFSKDFVTSGVRLWTDVDVSGVWKEEDVECFDNRAKEK